jgi:LysR family glycine cleavage system transcriptional activator
MDRLPPLNALRVFEVVGRTRSVRKAAGELLVTPGAVSRQIQHLEAYLGSTLFKREAGALILSRQGEVFLKDVHTSFEHLRTATRRLSGGHSKQALKIRAYTTVAMKWLIPRLSSFHNANKDIEAFITTSLDDVDFTREDIDCTIKLGNGRWSGCEADKLIANIMIPVCSPKYREATKLARKADLMRATLLHSMIRPDDWTHWLNVAGVKNIDPSGLNFENSALAYQAAIEGQGVAMAHEAFVLDDLRSNRLVQPFGPKVDRENFTYYLVYPKPHLRNPAFRKLRDWLVAAPA